MVNELGLSLKLKLGNGEESLNLSHPFTKSSFDYGRHFLSKRRFGDTSFMLNSVERCPFRVPLQGCYPSEGSSSQQGPNTTLNLGNPNWNMNPRLRGLNQDPNVLAPKLDLSAVNGKRVAAEREVLVFDVKGGEKKKLRLSKDQCTVLEQTFVKRSTLNNKEKRNLATQLALKPRQVEVWFQNRRARTKLKQTEVDRLFLKKYCEELSDENKRLHKQIQELRSQRFKAGYLADVDDQESQPESSVSVGHFVKMGD